MLFAVFVIKLGNYWLQNYFSWPWIHLIELILGRLCISLRGMTFCCHQKDIESSMNLHRYVIQAWSCMKSFSRERNEVKDKSRCKSLYRLHISHADAHCYRVHVIKLSLNSAVLGLFSLWIDQIFHWVCNLTWPCLKSGSCLKRSCRISWPFWLQVPFMACCQMTQILRAWLTHSSVTWDPCQILWQPGLGLPVSFPWVHFPHILMFQAHWICQPSGS